MFLYSSEDIFGEHTFLDNLDELRDFVQKIQIVHDVKSL